MFVVSRRNRPVWHTSGFWSVFKGDTDQQMPLVKSMESMGGKVGVGFDLGGVGKVGGLRLG